MAERDGVRLREELTYEDREGRKALTWGEAVESFAGWYDDQRGTEVVVENQQGDRTTFPTPNRFTPEYREMLYAKAQSLERGLRERWGKLLHTAMLTLTCSTTDADGRPRPPVEHLEELLSSWEAVRRSLSRTLDGRGWEYLAILEPHESGYAHVHVGVFVKGPVVAEQFRPVMDAHLRNCEGAGRDAHRIEAGDPDAGAVAVHRVADRRDDTADGVQNLGAYLAAYMAGEYGTEASQMPEYVQGFYATMWATGRQWFRPSNGAQELMQPEDDEDDEEQLPEDWSMVGIAPDGDLDDVIEKPDEDDEEQWSCGVEYRQVYRRRELPSVDPPPEETDPPPVQNYGRWTATDD